MQETLKNLTKAFIGESQARNRYTMYAKIAKKEGYVLISEIFRETAEQELEHASTLFEFIQKLRKKTDAIEVDAEAPLILGTTADNLRSAISGETYEYTEMYPDFAKIAQKEGFKDIAARLRAIGKAEEHHAERYQKLLNQVEQGTFFEKETEVDWVCLECGYEHRGTKPPKECPSCHHSMAYFRLKCENY
jgi:rubrerythrin